MLPDSELFQVVSEMLERGWSPQQIASRLKHQRPDRDRKPPYMTKGTNLPTVSQEHIDEIAALLNSRPAITLRPSTDVLYLIPKTVHFKFNPTPVNPTLYKLTRQTGYSMKIVITGGAGFIGSAVVRHIIRNTDDQVVNLDKLTYAGNLNSLADVMDSDRHQFIKMDICDRDTLDAIFLEHQPDAVMHLAAESHVDRSIDGPAEFIQTNIVGTYNLLEAARAFWTTLDAERQNNFRFHHISTDEVYGDLPHPTNAPDALQHLFKESTPYAPSSPYSASKASSDHLVRAWHRTYKLPTIITNCSNNYGPYHYPEKLIPLVILRALDGKELPVYGAGDQIRDWLYVEDHVKALYLVLKQGEPGETYNIGGHTEKQNIEVVQKICDILDELRPRNPINNELKNRTDSYRCLITYVPDRPGHDRRYAIDASKIEKELGWIPEETFESGIRKTVSWYLSNLEWCQSALGKNYQQERLGMKK